MSECPSPTLGQQVSVVLLTFNCAHRIQPVLEQLLALGLPVIAVDNGSSDGTAEVLARAEATGSQSVEVVALRNNIGAAARNAGAERAHTPYILFCDDDGFYEPDGLQKACQLFDLHPSLGLLNARILVGPANELDPISAEMAASPIPERHGIAGPVLLSFMAGASMVRASAYKEVGGYDVRFFIGGEEETLSLKLAKAGWQMRYLPDLVLHHHPSLANAGDLRAFGMRNTLVNGWLHRPWRSAVQWTVFTLTDTPKNADYLRGLWLTVRALGWIRREREPMTAQLDGDMVQLDARRFAARRPLLTRRGWHPGDPLKWRDAR